ncbi:uncharacterized protein FA14DRAFT_130164, partial [Meira miltonrushii]
MAQEVKENDTIIGSQSSVKKLNRWEATIQEEELIQAAAMPLDEVPSCMNCFDKWAACFALGPQIRHVYRYGSINKCQGKMEDFKYCLTLKGLTQEEFRAKWIRKRAEDSASKRLEKSSEDVWELRKDP